MAGEKHLSFNTALCAAAAVFAFCSSVSANTRSEECPRQAPFVFREGDTLSEVLWFLGTEPVYGKRGWIERTIALNPVLEKYRGKQIPPGTRVMIPIKLCPLRGGWSLSSGELVAPYQHPSKNERSGKDLPAPEGARSDAQVKSDYEIPPELPTPTPTPT
ncbi:hypothetical protein EBU99_14915, partial [bacterium]|nr:hypothetical protein [bacterium]